MKIKESLAGLAAAGAVLLLAAPSQAATYLWTFSDASYNGSGEVVTDPTNSYAISGGGTVNGPAALHDTLSLFLDPTPGVQNTSPDGRWTYDNRVPPTFAGFLFTGGVNSFYNLFSGGSGLGPTTGLLGISNNGAYVYNGGNSITGTIQLTAVPEPMTWAMMLMGILGLGAVLRRTRQRQVVARA